jgi:hypothetical protein
MKQPYIEEDVSKRCADDTHDTEVLECPWRVFSRRTAAKVGSSDNQDLSVAEGLLVEDELGSLGFVVIAVAEVEESSRAETRALDGL